MTFIDWFMGNALVWVLIFCLIADAVIFSILAWIVFKEWRDRHGR